MFFLAIGGFWQPSKADNAGHRRSAAPSVDIGTRNKLKQLAPSAECPPQAGALQKHPQFVVAQLEQMQQSG